VRSTAGKAGARSCPGKRLRKSRDGCVRFCSSRFRRAQVYANCIGLRTRRTDGLPGCPAGIAPFAQRPQFNLNMSDNLLGGAAAVPDKNPVNKRGNDMQINTCGCAGADVLLARSPGRRGPVTWSDPTACFFVVAVAARDPPTPSDCIPGRSTRGPQVAMSSKAKIWLPRRNWCW